MTSFVIFYPYHFVRTILSMPFCPIPFCPYTILSIPLCPYHFVRYNFVLEPAGLAILGFRGFRSCWCPPPFPSPSISRCFSFHFSSPATGFHSCFFLYDRRIC